MARTQSDGESIDPITVEVIRHGLHSAAERMKIAMRRTAFSPIIYDMLDLCCALYDEKRRLLGEAQAIPLFLGTMNFSISACVEGLGGEDQLEPGDVLFTTYGYDTGSHPQDAVLIRPAFVDSELIGYAVIKAHHSDMGAKEPYCTDTTDNFQEGLIVPGVKLLRRDELQVDLYRTIVANSRLPSALIGDLNAQIAAARAGADDLCRIARRYGLDRMRRACEQMFDHGEAVVRRFIAQVPDGRYVARGAMDSDGVGDCAVPFEVGIEVNGTDVVVDFADSPPAQRGPINCPLPITASAARLAIVAIAGGGELANEGHFRPIEVRTTPGTLFHALPPAPLFLSFWPAAQAVDVIHRALAEVVPGLVPAGSGGDWCGMVWWGANQAGELWAAGIDHMTGQGATGDGDGGPPLAHIAASGERNTPAETIELRHPMLVEKCELAPDSGGPGRFRGGCGLDVHYRMLADGQLTAIIERTTTDPWGLQGGGSGRANRLTARLPSGERHDLGKVTGFVLPEGTVVELAVGGGGGFGPQADRDTAAIHQDIADGYVSEEMAKRDYPHAFPVGDQSNGPSAGQAT